MQELTYSKMHLIQSEAAQFRPLALRSSTSKSAALQWIRDEIAGFAESVFDLRHIRFCSLFLSIF